MSHDLSQPIRTGWEITDAQVREGLHSIGVWTLKTVKQSFKCKECKFTTSSEQGLKIHVAKKHKVETDKETSVTVWSVWQRT